MSTMRRVKAPQVLGPASLREARQRTMQLVNFEDGMWDILMGFVYMALAVYPMTRTRLGPAWNLFAYLMVLVRVMMMVRKRVSVPRVGFVRGRPSLRVKVALVVVILLVMGTVGIVLVTLLSPERLPPAPPAETVTPWRAYGVEIAALGLAVVIFSVMGAVFAVPRLYLYGWLVGGALLTSAVLDRGGEGFDLPMGTAAGIILVIGAVLLVRFLRRYPLRAEGE